MSDNMSNPVEGGSKRLSRRDFLKIAGTVTAGTLLAACTDVLKKITPSLANKPTAVPEKPTLAPTNVPSVVPTLAPTDIPYNPDAEVQDSLNDIKATPTPPDKKPVLPVNPPDFATSQEYTPDTAIQSVLDEYKYRALFIRAKEMNPNLVLTATNYKDELGKFQRAYGINVISSWNGKRGDEFRALTTLSYRRQTDGKQVVRWSGYNNGSLMSAPDIQSDKYWELTVPDNTVPVFRWGDDGNPYLFFVATNTAKPTAVSWFSTTDADMRSQEGINKAIKEIKPIETGIREFTLNYTLKDKEGKDVNISIPITTQVDDRFKKAADKNDPTYNPFVLHPLTAIVMNPEFDKLPGDTANDAFVKSTLLMWHETWKKQSGQEITYDEFTQRIAEAKKTNNFSGLLITVDAYEDGKPNSPTKKQSWNPLSGIKLIYSYGETYQGYKLDNTTNKSPKQANIINSRGLLTILINAYTIATDTGYYNSLNITDQSIIRSFGFLIVGDKVSYNIWATSGNKEEYIKITFKDRQNYQQTDKVMAVGFITDQNSSDTRQ